MINDTVGRASLLPRLSTSRNRVYPCTGYRSAYTMPLRLYQRTTASILPARSADLSRSRSTAPREAFISAYDSSNSAPGLTAAEEFKMATLSTIRPHPREWQLSILCSWTFQLNVPWILHINRILCRIPISERAYREQVASVIWILF